MITVQKKPQTRIVATIYVYSDQEQPGIIADIIDNPLYKLYLAIADYTGIDFSKRGHARQGSDIRAIFSVLAYGAGHRSKRIAEVINRDHSTVFAGIRRHEQLIAVDAEYQRLFSLIKKHLQEEELL